MISSSQETSRYLLTVLGLGPRPANYGLEGKEALAPLAPLALIELLPDSEKPHWVVALCTPEAKQGSLGLLEEGLRDRCELKAIDVPGGTAQGDVHTFLEKVAGAIPTAPEIRLTVDVTHGFRHFSFLTYVAVLYLTGLRGVRLSAAYYGLLREKEVSPFLDLGPLLALPRWFHVLEVLRETGSARPMADALGAGRTDNLSKAIARELRQISESYLSGLPLELGYRVQQFFAQKLKPLRRLLKDDHRLPLVPEMLQGLKETLAPFALPETVRDAGWKRSMPLGCAELERQAHVIDDLFQREHVAIALGLLNEWTVSWVVWRLGREHDWLDFRTVRRSGANLLGAAKAVSQDPALQQLLTEEERELGLFWEHLSSLRNAFHHQGMRPQVLIGDPEIEKKLHHVKHYWGTVLRSLPDFSLRLGTPESKSTLVSPIGKLPGVLYSALKTCTSIDPVAPCTCLVICSRESKGAIDEVARHAGYEGRIIPLLLDDPFGGNQEIQRLVQEARPHLLASGAVFVNVTGGTTLMGLAAGVLAEAARKLARPVRRFGLIDRRPPERQREDPYQAGEPIWLEEQAES